MIAILLKDLLGYTLSWLWKFKPYVPMVNVVKEDLLFLKENIQLLFQGKLSALVFLSEID